MRLSTLFCTLLVPAFLSISCGGDKGDSAGSGSEGEGEWEGEGEGEGEGTDCGSNAPEIVEVVLSNGGLVDVDGEMVPAVIAELTLADADGDLTELTTEIFLDQEVDGTVDDSDSPFQPSSGTVDAAACEATDVVLSLALPFPADAGLEYGTELELGFIVSDAQGNRSNLGIGAGCLPNADGSDCETTDE